MQYLNSKKTPGNNHAHSVGDEIVGVLGFVASIWAVSIAAFFWDGLRASLALVPRQLSGLTGIVTMPWVHSGLPHLISNSVPLLVLLVLLAGSRGRSWSIVGAIVVVNGALLWLLGGVGAHIGASGLVMGLITFLISSGWFEWRPVPLLISAGVGLFYGSSLIWNLLPLSPTVSWTGHLFGAIAGIIVGYAFVGARIKNNPRS